MAKGKKLPKKGAKSTAASSSPPSGRTFYCSVPEVPPRAFKPGVDLTRASIIRANDKKWVNGTILHYYFFEKPAEWATNNKEKDVVRQAFGIWKNLGIGLDFKEVKTPDEAQIRIGFKRGDGAWSYVGRDILDIGRNDRTMNFGWDLTTHPQELDTALHEIGHALGCHHEHQNPQAGIVWDEEAVYTSLAQPPNLWSRETTYYNIIRKIPPDSVQGSAWDPDSIMEYPFDQGLIKEPEHYRNGLYPAGGLSSQDKTWVKTFYPKLADKDYVELELLKSVNLKIAAGEQRNFIFKPNVTRKYTMRTFGESDTIMVLLEDDRGKMHYLSGDDDSGEDYNASITERLIEGRKYILRIRLFYSKRAGETAIMIW